jgi:outer membrane protein TolC
MPLGNNAARGLMRQQAALVEAQRIRINELGHVISGSIETSAYAIVRAVEQLKEADAAVKTYAVGLANERTKRRLGLSTLIDILNVEDRYNNALLSAVQARQAYASAIAQFRFEAGMLLSREGDSYTARIDELLTPTASVTR